MIVNIRSVLKYSKIYIPLIEMKLSFLLQAMNLDFIKLSQLFLNDPRRYDLHSIKRKMEDIDQKTTIRMGKLECLNIDYDIRKYHAKAISTFVSIE